MCRQFYLEEQEATFLTAGGKVWQPEGSTEKSGTQNQNEGQKEGMEERRGEKQTEQERWRD